ncbi:MAG: hypothetical protein KJN90_05075 [Gammaproteobacteria bacterium]|nr:hypothetical protein [Gammaproteobacteria bacterium]
MTNRINGFLTSLSILSPSDFSGRPALKLAELWVLALVLGFPPLLGLAAEAVDDERRAEGEAQYNQLCRACHDGSLLEAPNMLFELIEFKHNADQAVSHMPVYGPEMTHTSWYEK